MSEIRLSAPVKATLVVEAFDADDIAGAVSFEPANAGAGFWGHIRFRCPCGCGSFSRLPIGLKTKPPHGIDAGGVKATWQWDGNRETPTLSPSIHHIGHWHGWLIDGVWTQA